MSQPAGTTSKFLTRGGLLGTTRVSSDVDTLLGRARALPSLCASRMSTDARQVMLIAYLWGF